MSKTNPQLVVGNYYLTVDGRLVMIHNVTEGVPYPYYEGTNGVTYSIDGKAINCNGVLFDIHLDNQDECLIAAESDLAKEELFECLDNYAAEVGATEVIQNVIDWLAGQDPDLYRQCLGATETKTSTVPLYMGTHSNPFTWKYEDGQWHAHETPTEPVDEKLQKQMKCSPHKFVDVGFMHSRIVCKYCDIEKSAVSADEGEETDE